MSSSNSKVLYDGIAKLTIYKDKRKRIHKGNIKYRAGFIYLAMGNPVYVPSETVEKVRMYGSVSSKNKDVFDVKVHEMVDKFNKQARIMERRIKRDGYTDILMMNRQHIHSFHYVQNEKTWFAWDNDTHCHDLCALCITNEDPSQEKELDDRLEDDGKRYLFLNLLPPIGHKKWTPDALDECEPTEESEHNDESEPNDE